MLETRVRSTSTGSTGGTGGGMSIGGVVTSGIPTSILYVDASGNLGNDSNFTWSSASTRLTILGSLTNTVDSTSAYLMEKSNGTDVFRIDTATPKVFLTGDIDITGTSTFGGGYGSTGVTISSSGNISADGNVIAGGSLTVTSGGETLLITAGSPLNTVTYSTYPSANMYFLSGGNLDFDMFDSGIGAAKMRFLFGGADKGAYVDDLGEIAAPIFVCASGGEILRITAGSPSNSVTISTDPTSNMYLDSGGDMYLDVYPTGVGTAKFRFTGGGTEMASINDIGGFVFNEASNDADCRIEGNGDANLFYTDAGNDRVGIGIATPSAKLHGVSSTIVGCAASAVTDGSMGNSQLNFWVNEGSNNLVFKVKYSDGTVKSGTVALA